MIKINNKIEEVLKNFEKKPLSVKENTEIRNYINNSMKEVRRDYKRKEKLSEDYADGLIINC